MHVLMTAPRSLPHRYALPTVQPSAADPLQSAVRNLVDARYVLEDEIARDAWVRLLSLLSAVVSAQGSRRVLPDMAHTRVLAFLSEWSDPELFAPATARHPPFQSAFDEFRRAWEAQPSYPPSPHARRGERAPSPVRWSLSTAHELSVGERSLAAAQVRDTDDH